MSTTFDTLPPVSRSADVLHVGDTTGRLDHLPRSGSGLPLRVQQTEHSDRTSVTVRALRPLVISWIAKVLQQGGESIDTLQDEDAFWNELRYGQHLCKVLNILSPNIVRDPNADRGAVAALENLAAFASALSAYGVDKRYSFRPMDFVNATLPGDEAMVKVLAVLALYAAQEKQFNVPEIRLDRIRSIMEGREDSSSSLLNGSPSVSVGDEGLDRILEKLRKLESSQAQTFRKVALAELKLRHTIRGIADPAQRAQDLYLDDSKQVLSYAEALTDDIVQTVQKLNHQIKVLESSQHNILAKIGNAALAERIATIDEDLPNSLADSARHKAVSTLSVSDRHKSRSGASLYSDPFEVAKTRMSMDIAGTGQPAASAAPPKTMFSKVPPEVASANLPKAELMRLSAVYELIETEADYVRDLSLMINFHKPQLQESNMLPEEDINALFSNIDQLVPVNQQLLDRLYEKRDTDPFIPEVGDALVDVSESFKVYTVYCGNYPEAMKLVHKLQARPDMKEQLLKMSNSQEGRGLSLESFLIKPVQRICKYPLLIRELQKHTDKLSKDTISLNLAMTKIESVVAHVNEYTRQLGERDRLNALQSKIDSPVPLGFQDRKHVRDGMMARVVNGKPRERYVLLFTDVLLVCTPLKGGRYLLDSVYDVADLMIRSDAKGEGIPKNLKNAFQLVLPGDNKGGIILSATTEDDRAKWIEGFNSAIKTAIEDAKKVDAASKRTSGGSHLVQQFNSLQDGGDKMGTIRPSSWSMTMGGRRPLSRSGSTYGTSGTLRGTLKGWGTLKRKDSEFAGQNANVADIGANSSYSELEVEQEVEPEMVEVNGQIWKRTVSAMGTSYYYNPETKETTWRLPENFIVLDPETGKPLGEGELEEGDMAEDDDADWAEEEGEPSGIEPVEGYPDWRRVDRGDEPPYYYNVLTRETSWSPPSGVGV